MPLIRNRMTITPRPTKIQISKMCEMPNILPPLSTAPNKSFNHKGHEGTRRKSRALPSCIFASFLDLPDCVQVVNDLFRFSVGDEYFYVSQHDANTGVAPNVGAALTSAANPVAVQWIPWRHGIRLDALQRNRPQTETQGADLNPVRSEAIVKTAPGQSRDAEQKQGGQRHYQSQSGQRNDGDHGQFDRGQNRKQQRPQRRSVDLFDIRRRGLTGEYR